MLEIEGEGVVVEEGSWVRRERVMVGGEKMKEAVEAVGVTLLLRTSFCLRKSTRIQVDEHLQIPALHRAKESS